VSANSVNRSSGDAWFDAVFGYQLFGLLPLGGRPAELNGGVELIEHASDSLDLGLLVPGSGADDHILGKLEVLGVLERG
jgi:hypothetical protein